MGTLTEGADNAPATPILRAYRDGTPGERWRLWHAMDADERAQVARPHVEAFRAITDAALRNWAWGEMTPAERDAVRDNSGLSPQLIGLEGWRVEVIDFDAGYVEKTEGDYQPIRRRFIVGKSTGWAPCHLEIKTRRSMGGDQARREYASVQRVERVR